MQNNSTRNAINGDGIYKPEVVAHQSRNYSHDSDQQESLSAIEDRPSEFAYDNPLPPEKKTKQFAVYKLEQILDVLDQQVEILNDLKQTNRNQPTLPAEELHLSLSYDESFSKRKAYSCDDLGSSSSNRKSLLDHYIKSRISDSGNCGCHFHFEASELQLLHELNECYRKIRSVDDELTSATENSTQRVALHEEEIQHCASQVTKEPVNFIDRGVETKRRVDHSNQPAPCLCCRCNRSRSFSSESELNELVHRRTVSANSLHGPNYKSSLFIDNQGTLALSLETGANTIRDRRRIASLSRKGSEILSPDLGNSTNATCCHSNHRRSSIERSVSLTAWSLKNLDYKQGRRTIDTASSSPDQDHAIESVLECVEKSPNCCNTFNSGSPLPEHDHLIHRPARLSGNQSSNTSLGSSSVTDLIINDCQLECSLTYESTNSLSQSFEPSIESKSSIEHSESLCNLNFESASNKAYWPSVSPTSEDQSSKRQSHHQGLICHPELPSAFEYYSNEQPQKSAGFNCLDQCERHFARDSLSAIAIMESNELKITSEDNRNSKSSQTIQSRGASYSNDDVRASSPLSEQASGPTDASSETCPGGVQKRYILTAKKDRSSNTKRFRQSSASNILTAKLDDADHLRDMKAVKDIAKHSIPSLASLQYLPSQMDVKASRSIDGFATSKRSHGNIELPGESTLAASASGTDLTPSRSMTKQIDRPTMTNSTVSEQSRERDSEHDDSCLIHRLCLCNCMLRTSETGLRKVKGHTSHETGPLPSESPSKYSSSRGRSSASQSPKLMSTNPCGGTNSKDSEHVNCEHLKRHEAHSRARDNDSETNLRETRTTLPSHPSAASPRRRVKTREQLEEGFEKQSPSFLSLLRSNQKRSTKSASAHSSNSFGFEKYEAKARLWSKSRQPRAAASFSQDGLGSHGDLAASGRSSASDSHASDNSPLARFNKSAYNSTTVLETFSRAEPVSDESCYSELVRQDRKVKTKSGSCSNPSHHQKEISTYKRLLSPRKFFNSSASSICDTRKQNLHDEQSFLVRSLSRLSGRKRNHSNRAQSIQSDTSRASPTISISNNEPYSDSVNSLDDPNLHYSLSSHINDGETLSTSQGDHSDPATRPLNAPDMVLSQAEYLDVSSEYSCDMTRSIDLQHCNPGSAHSQRNRHRVIYSTNRHGSELCSNTSPNSDEGLYSPLSLPSSPRSRRRNRNNSPRLSHSPVPFISPPSESTKIEDGLKVCSTEHFEKHIENVKENQIEAQKKLFTAWINYFAPNLIRHDLFLELQDGIKLIGLLAALTHDSKLVTQYERLTRDKQTYINRLVLTPSSRLQHLSNVTMAIDYLRKNTSMKFINLNPMDIVSGKANVILGLCWGIILNYQFDQNFFKILDSSSNHSSSDITHDISRSSHSHIYEDHAKHTPQVCGVSSVDLLNARNNMLKHINKRFNLKLTNLTSSLIDGDVLLTIIRHLLPHTVQLDAPWESMSDDEKIDYAFQLANDHLNVPKLILASDLRQQTFGENNPKPLLVYLSMLLKANPRECSTDQMLELRQLDESLRRIPHNNIDLHKSSIDINARISQKLESIDAKGKFNIEKLHATLSEIKEIENLIKSSEPEISVEVKRRHHEMKMKAEQIESLIEWINRAAKLFETTQKSSADLAQAIEEYEKFFSPSNLPKLNVTLCPTLERQYRECLATAKQRVLSMEQTMKNWLGYDQAREELKNWLITAEAKLTEALRPSSNQGVSSESVQMMSTVDIHVNRLEDLVEYFELEAIEPDGFDESSRSLPINFTDRNLYSSSLGIDQLDRSLSGSLISLGSNCSRVSALTSSKRAAYLQLFNNFELKCRLLAATLEPEQRDLLLLGVKELKSKLKYITEYKVPQVISELRMSISRCGMSIEEQDEYQPDDLDIIKDEPVLREDLREQLDGSDGTCDGIYDESNKHTDEVLPSHYHQTAQPERSVSKKRNSYRLNGKVKSNKAKSKRKNSLSETLNRKVADSMDKTDDADPSFIKRFWRKLLRASRVSFSFNIVLLICLAGICVIPLIQKDACCELSRTHISMDKLGMGQRPT